MSELPSFGAWSERQSLGPTQAERPSLSARAPAAAGSTNVGWKAHAGDPTLISYWDGSSYTATMRWDGAQWVQAVAAAPQLSPESATSAWQPSQQQTAGVWQDTANSIAGSQCSFKRRRVMISPLRWRRKTLKVAVAAVACFALAVSMFVDLGKSPSAEASVINAVNTTMGDKTANMTVDSTEDLGPLSMTISGSGSVNLTQSEMDLQMLVSAEGQQIPVKAVYVGGTIYESVPGIAQLVPGKSWVSIDPSPQLPLNQGGSSGALGAGGNPTGFLRLLAQQGNQVNPIGPATVDGIAVQVYSVALSQSRIKAELDDPDLPGWVRQMLSEVTVGGIDFDVYIDGQGLLRRETVSAQISVASNTLSVDETMDFSDYGTPVTVTAPPASAVTTFQNFLSASHANLN